jgi:hypothetical protein
MKTTVLLLFFFSAATAISQHKAPDVPIHHVKPPFYSRCSVELPAYIDSALFSRYIDWALQKDSLPQQYKNGKPFALTVYYVISRNGKISDVKLFKNGEDHEEIFELIRSKLLSCPYQWSPAYRNGRPVTAYLKLEIVRNECLNDNYGFN